MARVPFARVLIAAAVLVALAGCTSDADDTAAPPDRGGPTSSTEAAVPAAVEEFTGTLDEFYVVPDPLPAGAPGDLIRIQRLDEVDGRVTSRIMYHSTDASGRDRAVTGVVTHPTGPAPEDGWPVVSTAHGTTGIAARCAPSRTGAPARDWGNGGVAVATDYVGMGPEGELHPYLSKPSEGNAVIDAVTAVRQLPAAHAGRRWVSIGHSQGGHGALSAHELAAERAPELELVGTVALAPAAMLEKVYGGIDPIVTSVLTMMALYGGTSEHPDLEPSDYLTADAQAAASIFDTGCLDEITETLIPVALAGAFTADPRTTEPAASMLGANDVGSVAVDDVPVLLASGTVDDRVVIDRVRDLFTRMCDAGQVTELHVIDGADHGSVIPATAELVATWVDARFDGGTPTDHCGTAAAG
ncbi:MAG: lipase family protein [Actinomycetota bacterium]|nr:lipase family protein [Actinomycetota bacterium]